MIQIRFKMVWIDKTVPENCGKNCDNGKNYADRQTNLLLELNLEGS